MLKACHARFKTGAKKSTRHALLGALPFRPLAAAPAQFGVVPKRLSFWGNQTDGDCVTAEEAYAIAVWSIMCGLDEVFVTEQEVLRWAGKYGYLNGATLTEVMDRMAQDGLTSEGGKACKDGPYQGVDYSNEPVLQAAIATGPVKIAIDAGALPNGAGSGNGWFDVYGGTFPDTDHCVGLSGYGTAAFLYGLMGLPVPAGVSPSLTGYLLFTWSSVGFVTHAWLMGTCQEAWVRTPTTVGVTPAPVPTPTPTPVPTPTPLPPVVPPPPPAPTPVPVVVGQPVPYTKTYKDWLGTHTEKGTITFGSASAAVGFHLPTVADIEALADAVFALLRSQAVQTVEAAVAAVIADAKAGNYGQALADVLSVTTVVPVLVEQVTALVEQFKQAFAAKGRYGFGPSDLLAWTQAIAAILAVVQQLWPKKAAVAGQVCSGKVVSYSLTV